MPKLTNKRNKKEHKHTKIETKTLSTRKKQIFIKEWNSKKYKYKKMTPNPHSTIGLELELLLTNPYNREVKNQGIRIAEYVKNGIKKGDPKALQFWNHQLKSPGLVKEANEGVTEIISDPHQSISTLHHDLLGKLSALENLTAQYDTQPVPISEFGIGRGILTTPEDHPRANIYLNVDSNEL